MNRKIDKQVKGFRTQDGAGVSLVRVPGHGNVRDFDPIVMNSDSELKEAFQDIRHGSFIKERASYQTSPFHNRDITIHPS